MRMRISLCLRILHIDTVYSRRYISEFLETYIISSPDERGVRPETREGPKKVVRPQTPGDVGASRKLVVITRAGMRGVSGRGEELMRIYHRIRRKKR